jgi:hypothetical protein
MAEIESSNKLLLLVSVPAAPYTLLQMQTNPRLDQERPVGFEMEYASTITAQYNFVHGNEQVVDEDVDADVGYSVLSILRETTKWAYSDRFLGNGYAAYIDCDMLEVCTPEAHPQNVGLLQLVSERIVSDALQQLVQERVAAYARHNEDVAVRWLLPLRVQGEAPAFRTFTSGFHENYCALISRELIEHSEKDISTFLGLYAMSQKVFSGQGMVDANAGFCIAQKEAGSMHGSSDHAMLKKDAQHIRYELRAGNYPLTAWQLRYRAAYTSAVLRYMEHMHWNVGMLEHLQMHYTGDSVVLPEIGEVSNYIGMVEYRHALDFQSRLHDVLARQENADLFTDIETEAIEQVGNVLAALQDNNFESLVHVVPWVRKALVIAKRVPDLMRFEELNSDEAKSAYENACKIALSLEVLGTGSRLSAIRQKEPFRYTHEEIESAVVDPPAMDVAKRRAAHIRSLHAKHAAKTHLRYDTISTTMYAFDWMSSAMRPSLAQ